MSFEGSLDKLRQQKALSTFLILLTLAAGILLGTLISTSVNAQRQQANAPDATPLVVPDPVQVSNAFTQIAKRIGPAVVNINSESIVKAPARRRGRPSRDEDAEDPRDLFRFFGRPFDFFGPESPQGDQRAHSLGSGVIVDPKGYIVTNHHVVEHADRIRIKLKDDQTLYDAKVIGTDTETDLAVIKIDVKNPLPYAKFGNSDSIQVGDWAVAIGSPFSFEQTMTAGIISAKGRESPFSRAGFSRQFQSFLQTDAAINQGNSGGPLLNVNGEVIGINTFIVSTSGGYEGIGFALPSNLAVSVYNHLIKEGKVVRGSIGILFSRDDNEALLRVYGAKSGGVLVDRVHAGGPAEKAGIKPEDVIVALDGKGVRNGEELVNRIANSPVGSKVKITVLRDGKSLDIPVTIADRAELFKDMTGDTRDEEPGSARQGSETMFGILVANLTPQQRERWEFNEPGGVLVTKVEPSSFAEDIGVETNDIIVSINRRPVSNVNDLRQIQRDLKPGTDVAFRVMRRVNDGRRWTWRGLFLAGVLPAQR